MEATSQRAPRPERPILWLALAAAAGAGAGVAHAQARGPALVALAASALAALAWTIGWAAAGGAADLGAPAQRGRPSAWLCALVAACACLRASALEPAAPDAMPRPGAWAPRSALHGRELGALGDGAAPVELGRGWAHAGERLALLAGAERTRPARGLDRELGGARSVWTPRLDEVVRLAPSASGASPLRRLRERLLAECDRAGGREHAALLRALVCGDTSRFEAETLDLFTRTGTRHLLAVSGQHVTWIAAFALRPFASLCGAACGWFRPALGAWVRELVFLASIAAYVPLTGGASPVRRAAVAFALGVAAEAWTRRRRGGRRVDLLSLWSAALLGEVTLAPHSIGSVALLLSYAATLGLLLGAGPLARWCGGAPAFELVERWPAALARRVRRAVALALGASLAAVLATLPISWTAFGEFSLPGAWITVVALPLFALLLVGAWLWVLAPGLALDGPCTAASDLLLSWFELGDRLPGTPLVLPPRPWPWLALASAAVFVALRPSVRARLRLACAALAAASWAALLAPWTAAPRGLEVVAFDVGHGTAVALRAPGGGAWLFDAGSRDRTRVAQGAVLPCLARWDVGWIGVVASHAERDHMSALPWITERFRARAWAGALAKPPAPSELTVDLDSGTLRLATSGPLQLALVRSDARAGNQGSRSLRATLGARAVLLCGDSEGPALARQCTSDAFAGPVDLLLAPHHGSDPDGLGALLERTRPGEVWISASAPAAILAELERRGIHYRETWSGGTLRYAPSELGP